MIRNSKRSQALKTCNIDRQVCGFSQQSHRFIKRDVNRIVDQLEGVWRQVVSKPPARPNE